MLLGTTPFTVEIRETYDYGARQGRVSLRKTENFVNLATNPSEAFTQGFTYTPLGDVGSHTYPRCTHAACTGAAATSLSVSYAYTRGFLTAVPGYATSISYHPSLLINQVVHQNNVTWTQTNDANAIGRPASIATSGANQNWSSGNYAYDGAGDVTKVGAAYYLYDSLGRLNTANQYADISGTGTATQQGYTYDNYGNLTAMTGASGITIPTSATTNRLTSSITYDAAGNLTSWNGNTYEVDAFGMTWRYKPAGQGIENVYLYTADDERIWSYLPGNNSRWTLRDLDGRVLREFANSNGTWSVQRDYVYRGTTLLAAVQPNGETYHIHPDHLGTPRLVTNAAKAKVAYHVYYPYGEELSPINQDSERMKFTAHERDLGVATSNADDIDYMHARFYNPRVGRFMSVDPGPRITPSNPQSWNSYAYVLANPVRLADPTGQYGRGTGFNDEEWARFNKNQQLAAKRIEETVLRLEKKAVKLDNKGKTGRAADLRTAAGHLADGAAALRSDGSDGKLANAVDADTYQQMGGSANGAAFVVGHGPIVTVNMGHPIWKTDTTQAQRSIGHESLHTAGLSDQRGSNGQIAYQYGSRGNRASFAELRNTPLALINPDHLMDLVY